MILANPNQLVVKGTAIADLDQLFGFFLAVGANIDSQAVGRRRFLGLVSTALVTGLAADNTLLCADADAVAEQNAAVDAADGIKAQETILANTGDDKSDLIHVSIQLDDLISFFFTNQMNNHVAHVVGMHLHGGGRLVQMSQNVVADCLFVAGNAVNGAQVG